jgi:hypothetical protein
MKKRAKKTKRTAPPRARIPLPGKIEKRHGDAKKFDRQKEKKRLQREFDFD